MVLQYACKPEGEGGGKDGRLITVRYREEMFLRTSQCLSRTLLTSQEMLASCSCVIYGNVYLSSNCSGKQEIIKEYIQMFSISCCGFICFPFTLVLVYQRIVYGTTLQIMKVFWNCCWMTSFYRLPSLHVTEKYSATALLW